MSTLPMVLVERLKANDANVRTDLGDLTELAGSIRAQGLLQPLVVALSSPGYVVIDGHRRLAAAKLAGVLALPCLVVKKGDATAMLATMLAASLHKDLTPLEQGRAFVRLHARGVLNAEIARMTGFSVATISARMLLLELPVEVQDKVADKTITTSAATDLARQVRRSSAGAANVTAAKSRWLAAGHALAAAVKARCTHRAGRVQIGVGCGQCWEAVIRQDERRMVDVEGAVE